MKKLMISLLFITGVMAVHGQAFGVKAGVNFANFTGENAKNLNVLTKFHAGVFYEIDMLKFLSLQPELLYSVQGAKAQNDDFELHYFTVPVMVKVYLTDSFNLQAGPQLGMLLNESDNFNYYQSKTFDVGLAAGMEFFVGNNIFLQARYTAGTNSVSENTDLKNTVVQVSIGYVF